MSNLISRQAAIDTLMAILDKPNHAEFLYTDEICKALGELPSAEPERPKEPCEFCQNHEKGDTLYESSSWDGGVGYDYVNDIKFCPICGRELQDG